MIAKRLAQRLEALAARLVWGLFAALPVDAASGLGGWLARGIGPRLKVSGVARRNLALVFPDKPAPEIEAIVQGVWDNLGRVVGEFPHLERIAAERVELVGVEHLLALRDDGLPGILISAHCGNWELGGAIAARHGLPLHVVYRAANNPWIEDLYRKGRGTGVEGLIQKGPEGARKVLGVLKDGGHLGMLVDQKMNDGIAVPFFGRDAMTAPAIAQFAIRYRCPLVPAHAERLGGARFRVTFEPPLPRPESGDRHEDIRLLMTAVNATVETWISARPEQWLWLHKRWPE